MKVRHTRASVIARVEAEYRSLDKLVRQLEPADFDRPAFAGWTVKDALAHVVAWKAQALRELPDEFFSGRERSTLWPADLDSHSAEHRKRHIARALAG